MTLSFLLLPSIAAQVMVAFPGALAVTFPFASTEAIEGALLVQEIRDVSALPLVAMVEFKVAVVAVAAALVLGGNRVSLVLSSVILVISPDTIVTV